MHYPNQRLPFSITKCSDRRTLGAISTVNACAKNYTLARARNGYLRNPLNHINPIQKIPLPPNFVNLENLAIWSGSPFRYFRYCPPQEFRQKFGLPSLKSFMFLLSKFGVSLLPSAAQKARGAPVSRSAPLCSGRKPNSVPLRLLKAHRRWSFISRQTRVRRAASFNAHATDTRDGPRGFPRDRAGDPASLFGLAPHGVYRAPPVARRAVGFYPAFSPLP
jgi:hypothetical protein